MFMCYNRATKWKENKKMEIYVGYVLSDYAHALWISASKTTVEKAIIDYKKNVL